MRYELQAAGFRDRLMIALGPVAVAGILAILVFVFLLVAEPGMAKNASWMLLLAIGFAAALAVYRARGPDHAGFVEMSGNILTHQLNGHLEVIDLSTVTQANCFEILGNKYLLVGTGNTQKELVYSAYSNDLIHEFRRALGPRLKEGWFEWVKTWYGK